MKQFVGRNSAAYCAKRSNERGGIRFAIPPYELITKDRDFPLLRAASSGGPTILWVRVGNADNRTLIAQILRSLSAIISAVERGETVIEFVGR